MRLIFKKEKNSNNINKTELIYLCLRNTIINLKKEDNFNNNGKGISFGNQKCEINANNGEINLSSGGVLRFGDGVYLFGNGGSGRLQIDSDNIFAGGSVGLITRNVKTTNLEVTNGMRIGDYSIADYIKSIITKEYVESLGITAAPASHSHSVAVTTTISGTNYQGYGTTTS